MMDKSTENSDEDRASLRSNGKTSTNSAVKETKGMLKTLRKSFRQATEKSPLSSGGKATKVTPKADTTGNELWSEAPPSPSLSAGSPVTSPLKNIGDLSQKKEEDNANIGPQKTKGLTRSKTDPNMSRFSESLKRGSSIRRSLRFGSKKDKEKTCRQEPLFPVSEDSVEEKKDQKVQEDAVWEELEESGLSTGSPVTSPLKNIKGFFQKKEEDDANIAPQKRKDPNMGRSGDSFKRGSSNRLSQIFNNKKDKTCGQEPLFPVSEGSVEKDEKVLEDVAWEELEESYTLPEMPHTPLSVMQINKLIEMEVLEEAHLNLLSLRQEFQQERERCGEDSPMELAKKEKDLSLLYGELRNKVNTIVRESNSLPARNKELLVPVARIIQEEERRAEEPGGLAGSWMEAWREAVGEGVQAKVKSIHLDQREQNTSWLAVHLGLLGKAILEDLENVKRELRGSYPPSFKVFSTYVKSYHRVVGQHVKQLEKQVTELKDLYALLDWIINRYKSERIMGSPSLQSDMKDERDDLQLEGDFLKQLKGKYCCKVKEELRSSLDRVIELENKELWKDSRTPKKEEDFLNSEIHMDIWTKVKGTVLISGHIDAQLEQKVISSCLEELKQFPKRFEQEYKRLRPQSLWTEYHITYINSFTALQQHMDGYQEACPGEVEGFRKEVKWLIVRLTQDLEDQFKEEVKPYLRRMMTRKWLTNDEDFKQLQRRTELLFQHCALMRPPHVQEFASRLHYHVVKEYIGQLMKNNYSCKNQKHEKAARKIREQWDKLRVLFEDMSTQDWLHYVGDDLCNIISTNKTEIKIHLQPLVDHYPDFSKKHLEAILYFRGLRSGREHQLILQRLTELKKKLGGNAGDKSRVLFGDMQVTVNTDCLSNLAFSCFSFLHPNN
ncbi:exocyst complex component 3-like protein 4 isoform X2 [Micropterus dolomieu]|uniref:exocyst complex component 3-like protein 4 isoform X2 n=1 Tax=Micropterus dolomieu TaxID=147949 RepID=UPI001E8DB32E|nr:exocyst complex component 3-like protein 4 isoform X2 [Micropterus dolomieu]